MPTLRHAASLGLQAAGSGATLLASAVIAAGFGLSAQGEFALVKSWVEALATLLALGLPQGLLHLLYRAEASEAALWRWSNRYLAGLLAVSAAVAALAWGGVAAMSPTQAAVAVALPAAVAHQLWRSLVLRRRGVVVFAAVTAAPALLLLASAGSWLALRRADGFGLMILVAWWAAALATGVVARPRRGAGGLAPGAARELWSVSLQAVLQTGAAALLPAALLSLAQRVGGSVAAVGALSLCMQVYLLFAVAAAYVAPLIYDASARGGVDVAALLRRLPAALRWGPPALAIAAPPLVALGWPALQGRVLLTVALGLAGVAALYARGFTTVLQARGHYAELSAQALLRLAGACAGCLALGEAGLDAGLAAGTALLAVELATAWRLAVVLGRLGASGSGAAAPVREGTPLLVLITTNHPFTYTGGETMFVGPELPALAEAFPDLLVAPLHAEGERLALPAGVRLDVTLAGRLGGGRAAWYLRALAWPGFAGELARALRRGGAVGVARVWRWAAQAAATRSWLEDSVPRGRPLLLYTYWRGGATLACARFARERGDARVVTRVHGYDLYEERFSPPFQPWRGVYDTLDAVVAISRHGVEALARYGVDGARVHLARLGTDPAAGFGGASADGVARVVSCSSVIPLKRVPLMARALAELARRDPARRIEWTHLGDGPELPTVRAALRDAPANLVADLPGARPHEAVLAHLATRPADSFLLLSETEGLPVSVQEALAHAIPVVATDVGGVAEAVDAGVGVLLCADPTPTDVADALASLFAEPAADRAARRQRALARWASDFDGAANRRAFAALLGATLAAPSPQP